MGKPSTVEQYIAAAPEQSREKLEEIRKLLKTVVPEAKESIKWGVPVFEEKRILFAYAAFKNHMNFMPTEASLEPFGNELKEFNLGKGSIQLPYNQPLPKKLILKIAKHRSTDVRENDARWM